MKITIAQLNYHVGNFESNTEKIIGAIKKAKLQKSDLIVFSELAVCGYPPLDMIEKPDFISNCIEAVNYIAKFCDDIAAIIGAPTINTDKKGKCLYNSALFIHEKKVKHIIKKTLLPDYDIFDEYRYFEPNRDFQIINFKRNKIALTICEDIWNEHEKSGISDKRSLYKEAPLATISLKKPDFVINIAASPYAPEQAELRKNVLTKNVIKYKLPIIYVNQVGANTDLIFDGGSMVMNASGKVVESCNYFSEDMHDFDTTNINKKKIDVFEPPSKIAGINNALVLGLKDFFVKNGFSKAVLGLSGGIDSAVTLAIAIQALGRKNIEVILLPSKFSTKHSVDDAIEMTEICNVKFHIIEIETARKTILTSLENIMANTKPDTTEENIQARLRGMFLMAFSNKFGHILLNTSNKSEIAVGYTTLYGDMAGSLCVLGDVYKTDVYELANFINKNIAPIIPRKIIHKPPSAELKYNQKDSDSLPEYNILDEILYEYLENNLTEDQIINSGHDKGTVSFVINALNNSEFKRFQSPPILRVSSKAFGSGRKIPLVANFD